MSNYKSLHPETEVIAISQKICFNLLNESGAVLIEFDIVTRKFKYMHVYIRSEIFTRSKNKRHFVGILKY